MVEVEQLITILQEKGIKPSFQRLKVLEYLLTQTGHPTADETFMEVIKVIPTLSKTTIYNTLDLLLKAGIVRPVTIEDNEVRYDTIMSTHGHFKCEICHEIYNFSVDIDQIMPEKLDDFHIKEKNIYFKGVCAKCADLHKS